MKRLGWFVVAALAATLTSACSGPTPPTSALITPGVDEPSPSPSTAAGTPTEAPSTDPPPTATPVPPLSIDDLERVALAEVRATAVCDSQPAQGDLEAGQATIYCSDSLALAVAAVRTITPEAPVRLYFHRPPCVTVPCSADDLSTATVTVWTASAAYDVRLDSRLETVTAPTVVDATVRWPASEDATPPKVARATIKGAPRAIAERAPYPYCGRAEVSEPPDVLACFRAAVLQGRPAEMIDQVYGTEGGEVLWIYRYDGKGRLLRFQHDQSVNADGTSAEQWDRVEGAMTLGINASNWNFDPWDGTGKRF